MQTPLSNYTAGTNGVRSLTEAISELNREVAVRRKIFDRWVHEGKLDWTEANDRMERILTALSFLVTLSYMLEGAGCDHHTVKPTHLSTFVIDASCKISVDTPMQPQAA